MGVGFAAAELGNDERPEEVEKLGNEKTGGAAEEGLEKLGNAGVVGADEPVLGKGEAEAAAEEEPNWGELDGFEPNRVWDELNRC